MTVVTHPARPSRIPTAVNLLAEPAFYWLMLVLYLAAHVALRLWDTPNIGKNEVQEALAAQGWAWGYHPRNPPLHTWLLMGSYAIFGVGALAHVILKYALLGATYGFAFLCGRRLLTSPALAALSAFSLTLLTPLAWTVHTALTHTLLLAAMIFATLWAALRLTARQRLIDYGLFGAVIGLGILAKYSYPLFLIPLLAAMLSQSELRRALGRPHALAALAAAMLVFAPHGVWMMTAQFNFAEFLAEKQRSHEAHSYVADVGAGLGAVVLGALSFLGPLLLTSLALLRPPRGGVNGATAWARAIPLVPLIGLGLLLADVILFRATRFEERYFLCALLLTPLALFSWLDRREPPLAQAAMLRFGVATLLAGIIVLAGLTGRALFYNRTCDRCVDEMPVADFVREIRLGSNFSHGTILADHYNVGGNLRLAFPNARVMAANYIVEQPLRDRSGQCLLVWNARNAGDAVPASIVDYLSSRHLRPPRGEPIYVNAPLHRSDRRMDRLAYWVLPNADGNCDPR